MNNLQAKNEIIFLIYKHGSILILSFASTIIGVNTLISLLPLKSLSPAP